MVLILIAFDITPILFDLPSSKFEYEDDESAKGSQAVFQGV
jgi:hypothetical protein